MIKLLICSLCSVSVLLVLEWSLNFDVDVVSLLLGEHGELSIESWQVEFGDLFVELLWKLVNLTVNVFISVSVLPKINLGEGLVSERAGHNERWMSGGATEIEESTLGKDDDTVTIWECVSINLWLNLLMLDAWVLLESSHINFIIKVTNVSNDGIVLHLGHMVSHDNSLISSGSDEDIGGRNNTLDFLDLESLHAGLESANWIALRDNNSGSAGFHGGGASFSDITVSEDHNLLSSDHYIGGSHKTIRKGVSASINIIELGLGDTVVNVNGLDQKLTLGGHLVKSVYTSGGLLGDTLKVGSHLGPFLGKSSLETFLDDSHNLLELEVVEFGWIWELSNLGELSLGLDTLVDEEGSITTIINENIWTIAVGPGEHLVGAIPVLLEGLSFPCENLGGLGLNDSSSGVVLSGVDVAGSPSELSSKAVEGLDEGGGLDGHVERSRNLGTLKDLLWSKFFSNSHKTWHLNLCDVELSSSEVGLFWELDIRLEL